MKRPENLAESAAKTPRSLILLDELGGQDGSLCATAAPAGTIGNANYDERTLENNQAAILILRISSNGV
jgi:hypothetical protein